MKTVLVIEDDGDTRLILEDILSNEGYETIAVEAGDGAIQYLSAHDPPCLVLLDMRLPRMDGVSFLHWLNRQERLRHLPLAGVFPLGLRGGWGPGALPAPPAGGRGPPRPPPPPP